MEEKGQCGVWKEAAFISDMSCFAFVEEKLHKGKNGREREEKEVKGGEVTLKN